ncbi:MAG: tRNA dihydrouridine synthase DusB [Peptoniphilaceae bacterium]|nr:tRNA dihydrouridine synthase DusB [Peptoniphilaceae bacterium]MDD7383339.1 tRNA dihydrouridine synthase DusB [Peptoniphilaceae bacterium]MDY3738290.1 tRNA dihydrouridine synthase DusB [Peptoniphilaceae bacterium]
MKIPQNKKILLAPLAGVSDVAFRIISQKYGADGAYTEMISIKGLYYNDEKTEKLGYIDKCEKNTNIQIFGSDPEIFEKVIKEKLNPRDDIKEININMGCPAPKITKNKEGSFLLTQPNLVKKILKTCVKSSNKKVTLKYRMGFEKNNLNYIEIGKIAQDAGISSLTLHARSRNQFYEGKADWSAIKKLKESVQIPVYANGDIFTVNDFIKCMEYTNADGCMIARGAMGNPFIFKQIKDYLNTGFFEETSFSNIIREIKNQYEISLKYKPERIVINQMRKHVSWYLKGLNGSSKIKNIINNLKSLDEIYKVLDSYEKYLERNVND